MIEGKFIEFDCADFCHAIIEVSSREQIDILMSEDDFDKWFGEAKG
jgi:hypothetical protein